MSTSICKKEIIGNLRQLKQIDAEWNIDVFKSKMGINNNYDRLRNHCL